MSKQEKIQAYALDTSFTFDRKKKHLLLSHGKNKLLDLEEAILKANLKPDEIEKYKRIRDINIEEKWRELEEKNIHFTFFGEDDYPNKLLNIPDPPFAIYYKGELPKKDSLNVAIIGARQNSEYGNYMAKEFAKAFAINGINVVSGMALGIDGISQRESLNAGGKSYAVLGCGVDVIYPPSNKGLYNKLLIEGGVISEYAPGIMPIPKLFPPRNRIISGLSDCILVVEAREKSGTLITVDMALEQGKEVYVIPGRCTDSLSVGCNKLIRNGAACVCTPDDLLQDMGWICEDKKSSIKKQIKISQIARELYSYLSFDPKTQDDIMNMLILKDKKLSVSELSSALIELELVGLIQRNFGQYSVKTTEFNLN